MRDVWCALSIYIILLIISSLIPLPDQIAGDNQHYINYVDQRNRKILYTPIVIDGGNQNIDYNIFLDLVLLCKNKRHIEISIKDYAEQIIEKFPSMSEKIGDITHLKHKYIYYNSYYHVTIQYTPNEDNTRFVQIAENIAYDCGFKLLYQTQ
jgi:hypothetical protein